MLDNFKCYQKSVKLFKDWPVSFTKIGKNINSSEFIYSLLIFSSDYALLLQFRSETQGYPQKSDTSWGSVAYKRKMALGGAEVASPNLGSQHLGAVNGVSIYFSLNV